MNLATQLGFAQPLEDRGFHRRKLGRVQGTKFADGPHRRVSREALSNECPFLEERHLNLHFELRARNAVL